MNATIGTPSVAEHANVALLRRLFAALQARDHEAMAKCYAPTATFRDIAFTLSNRREIHAMWRMICDTGVTVTVEHLDADDRTGHARTIDRYTFSDTGLPVVNQIQSRFEFENGAIVVHRDECDARRWAEQAFGGTLTGWVAGRFRPARAFKARKKLRRYLTP
jgi:hypothetical protein